MTRNIPKRAAAPTPLPARATSAFLMILALGAAASSAAAQDPRLRSGVTVRFSTDTTETQHVAELARATPDSLFLYHCRTCLRPAYSLFEVKRLAVMRPAHRGSRFLTGFGFGGLAGIGIGFLAAGTCHGGDRCDGSIVLIPAVALVGGLVGGLAGYLTGYTWDAIPPARR